MAKVDARQGLMSRGDSPGVRQAKLAFVCFAVLLLGLIGVVAQQEFETRADPLSSDDQAFRGTADQHRLSSDLVRAAPVSPTGADVTVIAKTLDPKRQPAVSDYQSVASAGPAHVASVEPGNAAGPSQALHEPVPTPSTRLTRVQTGSPVQEQTSSTPASPQMTVALSVPRSVRVLGPLTFEVGSTRYRLQSADGLGVSACSSRREGRCFRRPRGDLKQAIAGTTLQCRSLEKRNGEIVVACTKVSLSSLP